jgi:hypothetical protein
MLTIPIDEADSEPLVGMSLMEGYQLTVQVFEGGHVELGKVKQSYPWQSDCQTYQHPDLKEQIGCNVVISVQRSPN